jgi:hypothetical protein
MLTLEGAPAVFVDGRGSRLAAGRTPRAGAGALAASGSRSGAVHADIRLDVGGRLVDGGQVDAEQLRAPLQWRLRSRPTTRTASGSLYFSLLGSRLDCWRMGRPLLAPGASTGFAMRPGRNGGSGAIWGGGAYRTPCPWWRGSGPTAEPGPRARFWAVPGRYLGPRCRFWSQAAMIVPRLVISTATMTPNALI